MGEKGFVAECLKHRVDPSKIDGFVDLWHRTETTESLSEFLGMTPDEYALWVDRPESLDFILSAHAQGMPLDVLLQELGEKPSLSEDARSLLTWWRARGMRNIA